jgi:methyl-accepting chemotaxis protein
MNWNRFRITARLNGGLALVLALCALTIGFGIWSIGKVARGTQEMMADPLVKERLAHEWFRNITAGVKRTTALAKSSDMTLEAVFAEEIKATSARTNEVFETLVKGADDEEKKMLAKSAELRKTFLAARQQVLDAKKEGRAEDAEKLFRNEFASAATAYLASVQAFLDAQIKSIDAAGTSMQADASRSSTILAALGALTLLLSAVVAWTLARSITRPLAQAVNVARVVATGDLSQTIEVTGNDEVADLLGALKDMQRQLGGVVSQIREGLNSVSTASQEIAQGNADLSQRTEQATSSLQQTSGSMAQLTGTVTQTADSARTANQLASSASAVAQRGGEVVAQVVTTMEDINTSSRKIADIIGTIDGIAFQTNILALNAAVEAARAGEQGRGFAVVAGEVRNLAGRSAEAAREIKSLIGASVEKVESGSRLVKDAGSTMTEIVASVQRVSDIIGEISAAATEQSAGIGQVNSAVNQLDQMTQQNAALVEESAAAAESLKGQANTLGQLVAGFRTNGYVAPAASSPAKLAQQTVARVAAPRLGVKASAPAPAPAQKASAAAPLRVAQPVAKPVVKPAAPATPAAAATAPAAIAKAAHAPASAPAAAVAASGNDSDWETF